MSEGKIRGFIGLPYYFGEVNGLGVGRACRAGPGRMCGDFCECQSCARTGWDTLRKSRAGRGGNCCKGHLGDYMSCLGYHKRHLADYMSRIADYMTYITDYMSHIGYCKRHIADYMSYIGYCKRYLGDYMSYLVRCMEIMPSCGGCGRVKPVFFGWKGYVFLRKVINIIPIKH